MAKDLESVKRELKSKLPDYLKDLGLIKKHNSKFKCINPDHEDSSPSMSIYSLQDGTKIAHCFGCGASYDIFHVNHHINGAPIVGYEFITDNIAKLAEHFGIDLELRPMTPEEVERMNLRELLAFTKNLIVSNAYNPENISESVEKYMRSKMLTKAEYLTTYGIGVSGSYETLIRKIIKAGYSERLIEKAGIVPKLFAKDNLIFTIADEYGVPRGFSARNCIYNKEDGSSKYYNTKTTDFFVKSELLYNLHRVIKTKSHFGSVYIVEGQTDAIALDLAGIKAVALNGTELTNGHIAKLQSVGINDIVILLDGDEVGKKKAGDMVTKLMEGIRNFRVRIALMPEGMDPDELVRKEGKKGIMNLPHFTTFEWRIKQLKEQTDLTGYEIAEQTIPLIINEKSNIERDRMAKILSEITDIPLESIRKDIAMLSNERQIKLKMETDALVDNIIVKLKKNPNDASIILHEGLSNIRNITQQYERFSFDHSESYDYIRKFKMLSEQPDAFRSVYLKSWPYFERMIDGMISEAVLLLGGQPNAGKTSFIINLIRNILDAHEGDVTLGTPYDDERFNDITIIFHTLDDPRNKIIPRFVASLAYESFKKATINHVAFPWKYDAPDREDFLIAREEAYNKLMMWTKEGRLILKGSEQGKNLSSADMMIDIARQNFPDRKIWYFCDNMYKLKDFANAADDNKRIAELSNAAKDLSKRHGITSFYTVEYRKGKMEGGYQNLNEMMRESKGVEYDADWIGHLLNPMHTNEDTDMYFVEEGSNKKMPIISLVTGKNKLTDLKGKNHYFFHPSRAMYSEVNSANVNMCHDGIRDMMANIYNSKPTNIAYLNKKIG